MPIVKLHGTEALAFNELANFDDHPKKVQRITDDNSHTFDKIDLLSRETSSHFDTSSTIRSKGCVSVSEYSDVCFEEDERTLPSTIDDLSIRECSSVVHSHRHSMEASMCASTRSLFSEVEKVERLPDPITDTEDEKSISSSSLSLRENGGIPVFVQRVRASIPSLKKSREELLKEINDLKSELREYKTHKQQTQKLENEVKLLRCEVNQFRTKEKVYVKQITEVTRSRDEAAREVTRLSRLLGRPAGEERSKSRSGMFSRFFSSPIEESHDEICAGVNDDDPIDEQSVCGDDSMFTDIQYNSAPKGLPAPAVNIDMENTDKKGPGSAGTKSSQSSDRRGLVRHLINNNTSFNSIGNLFAKSHQSVQEATGNSMKELLKRAADCNASSPGPSRRNSLGN